MSFLAQFEDTIHIQSVSFMLKWFPLLPPLLLLLGTNFAAFL